MGIWAELSKLLPGAVIAFSFSLLTYLLKEWRDSRKEAMRHCQDNKKIAQDIYDQALSLAEENRRVTQSSVSILRNASLEIQLSPIGSKLEETWTHFEKAAAAIATPNSSAAHEFYLELYKLEADPTIEEARRYLKQARHFLSTNQAANQSMLEQINLLRMKLQLSDAAGR